MKDRPETLGRGEIMRRNKRYLALLLVLVLALAACASDGDENGGDAATDDTDEPDTDDTDETDEADSEDAAEPGACDGLDEIHVATPSQPPDFVQLTPFIARDAGFFEEHCLDVELAELRSGINALRAMQSGETDVSFSGTVSFVNAIGQASPVRVWASSLDKFDFQVVATETSGIGACEELEGNTLATDGPGGLVHALAETFLATCGLDITTDVDVFIGSPQDFGPQMEQGIVQAGVLHTDEMVVMERERDIEFTVLGLSWEFAADFHYISFGSTENLIAEKRDQYVQFVAALLETNAWIKDPANRAEVVQLAVDLTAQDEDVMEQTYDEFVDNFPTTCDEALPSASIEYLISLQQELGNLEAELTFEDVVDISICRDAEQLIGQ